VTARDARGRFVSQQEYDRLTAERVLEAAVEDVVAIFMLHVSLGDCSGCNVGEVARDTLVHATHAADMLLDRRAS
jgi:hypothetical protein